jgi:hypothetical protein
LQQDILKNLDKKPTSSKDEVSYKKWRR